jgi:sulfoxide reductase heme-binding subunit YedZ
MAQTLPDPCDTAGSEPDRRIASPGGRWAKAPTKRSQWHTAVDGQQDPKAAPGQSILGLSTRGFTVATGYVATGLLAFTLIIGPANLLFGRRNPVSSYLRRDVGMWTAIVSVVHVIYGLQVHRPIGDVLRYFLGEDGRPLTNSFGLANWSGLGATVVVMGLLAISSDRALRKLKARRWKRIQRMNYALLALVLAHAFFYGALVRTNSPYTLALLLSTAAVVVAQSVGIGLWRRDRNPHVRAS